MKPRFVIRLEKDVLKALEENAAEQRRNPRDQAAILIRRALGLAETPPQQETENDPDESG